MAYGFIGKIRFIGERPKRRENLKTLQQLKRMKLPCLSTEKENKYGDTDNMVKENIAEMFKCQDCKQTEACADVGMRTNCIVQTFYDALKFTIFEHVFAKGPPPITF